MCWLKAFALELGVVLIIAGFVAAALGACVGITLMCERAPQVVQRSLKWTTLSIVILGACLFAGTLTWKAHDKVCAVGLKAAWTSVWEQPSR